LQPHHGHPQSARLAGQQIPGRKFSTQQSLPNQFFTTQGVECESAPANQDKVEIIPINMDKPSGLPMNDFLPKKFQVIFKSLLFPILSNLDFNFSFRI